MNKYGINISTDTKSQLSPNGITSEIKYLIELN